MFRAVGATFATVAVLATVLVPAGAAQADAQTPTHFTDFTVTPTNVDVDHDTVTYSGRLVYQDADGAEHGLPDVSVCLAKDAPCLQYTQTDVDGRFSADIRLSATGDHPQMVEGNATAHYQGTRDYSRATSSGVYINVSPAKTRLSVGLSSTPHVVGDKADVTGRLERQRKDDGTWTGAPGQPVKIIFDDADTAAGKQVATAYTADDGTYSISVTVPGEGQWEAETPALYERVGTGLHYGVGPYDSASAITSVVQAKYRTSITGFDASPEPVGRGATVTGRGRAMKIAADGSLIPYADGVVDLQFSADGKKWQNLGDDITDAGGNFTTHGVASRDGYWRAYAEDGYETLPSASATDYVDTKYRTRISGINASPEPVRKGKRITVTGVLQRNTSSWKAFTGRSVKIYFRAKGGTKWTYAGTAKTSGSGRFTFGAKASKDGYWRATYAGDSSDLAVTSGSDYVDVR